MFTSKNSYITQLLMGFLILSAINNNVCKAQENSQGDYTPQYVNVASSYEQKGIESYNANDFNTAIQQFEQALKINPLDSTIRNNLAASYIARGAFQHNKKFNYIAAANDFRKAIFYLKYDENTDEKNNTKENISIAKTNLSNALELQRITLNPKNRYKIARELRGQGKFQEAVVEFNEALGDSNLKFDSLVALGEIMMVIQRFDRSSDYFSKALEIKSDNADLHLKFANALHKAGNIDDAIKEYNIALTIGENNPEIIATLENIWRAKVQETPKEAMPHMNLGTVLQKKGNFEEALGHYKAAELIEPNNPTIRLNLGTLYQAQGNLELAMSAYDSILQVNPTDALVHYYRATALKKMGKVKEALDELQIVLKLNQGNLQVKKEIFELISITNNEQETLPMLEQFVNQNLNDPVSMYNLGYEFHKKKIYPKAVEYYQKALSMDNTLVDAYLNLASIYKENNQHFDAVQTLKNGLSAVPDNANMKDLLAKIQYDTNLANYQQAAEKYQKGDYQGAIAEYMNMIQGGEETTDIYTALGSAHQALNQTDEAINAYNKAISLDKNNSTAIFYLGTIYQDKNNLSMALEQYKKASALSPQNSEIKEAIKSIKTAQAQSLIEKGYSLYNESKYPQALTIFNSAISLDPSNGYGYYYRGMLYDTQKKYALAIEDYKKAVLKSKDLNVAYYSLAIDYDLLKNTVEAKKAYQKFITLSASQEDEYVKYAKQRVKQLK